MSVHNYYDEIEKLRYITKMARIGWWEADFDRKTCIFSELLVELFNLTSNTLSFDDFHEIIREDYRTRVANHFLGIKSLGFYEQNFPVYAGSNITWIHSHLISTDINEQDKLSAFGFIQIIEDQETNDVGENAVQRVNNLLHQQNSISHSLLSFLTDTDVTGVINDILRDLLVQFNAGRSYIIEYDWEAENQSCTYEVVSREELRERNNLQKIPFEYTTWWTEQLTSLKPIILNSLDELPVEIQDERELLDAQSIKSMLVVPLIARDNKIWGYAGIDTVDEYRKWSEEDHQWFSSLTNIVSICLELRKSELKALEDKNYTQNLYKHMPVGYVRIKLIYKGDHPVDYLFLDGNEAFGKLTGFRLDYILGKKGSELGADTEKEMMPMLKVLENNEPENFNYYISGNETYCNAIMYSPQRGEIVSLMTDVTDTYLAHEALDRSEKILRNIYENLPVGIELYDKNACLIDVNDKNLEIFGLLSKEKVLGFNLFDHPALTPELVDKIKNKEDLDFSSKLDITSQNDDYVSDKRGIINLVTKVTCLYDRQNNLLNYLVINLDNTETENVQNKILEFEEFFSVIADYAKVGYFKWNPITKEGFAINQWLKNLGRPEHFELTEIDEIYGNLHPDDFTVIKEFYDKALKGEVTSLQRELRVVKSDETLKWIRCSIMVKEYDPVNNNVEFTGVNFDITELKDIQEKLLIAKDKAEMLDKLKSAFLANMSHEIRTPLNAIVGFSNLLVSTEDLEERKEYVNIVQENNELLLQLISDILDLSKIEAGTFDFVKGAVNIKMMCRDIIRAMNMKITENVTLFFDEKSPEYYIHSDKNRLMQVLTNFMTNAIKFTPSGSVTLGYQLKDTHNLEFYVQDTGIGIAPDKVDQVFERFVKLNNFVQGTGLGLSICKSIIEQLDGNIGVESELGVGSRFWFTHPYQVDAQLQDTENTYLGEDFIVTTLGDKPTILVAEDLDNNYLLISTVLKKEYNLVRAYNGKEVLDLFEKVKPNLILMDVKMPVIDGIEATKRIRLVNKRIPIIAITAFAFDRDKQRTLEVGCNDFIAKPVSGRLLKEKISKLLNK